MIGDVSGDKLFFPLLRRFDSEVRRAAGQRRGVMTRSLLIFLGVVLLSACGHAAPNTKERQVIDRLTHTMKPVALGRMVMEMPEGMRIKGSVTLIYGLDVNAHLLEVEIVSFNSSPQLMRAMIDKEISDIAATDKSMGNKKSSVYEHKDISENMVYLYYDNSPFQKGDLKLEMYLLVDGTMLLLKAPSYEMLYDSPEDFQHMKNQIPGLLPPETTEQVKARLFKLASQIRAVGDAEKAGPGFALGPVVIDGDQDGERTILGVSLAGHPDVSMNIEIDSLRKDYENLIQRQTRETGHFGPAVLRQGETSLIGMKAYERIVEVTLDGHTIGNLQVETQRPDPGFTRPLLHIDLDTGGGGNSTTYVDPSLSIAEATGLWDAMIGSIHLRKNAVRTANGR